MTKALTKQLRARLPAAIINIGSVIGLMGNACQANYAASKAGLIGLTKSLAREFASRDVTANCIAPGFIMTDMTGDLDEKTREQIKGRIPLGFIRHGRRHRRSRPLPAAASGRYLTGQVLAVDGGMVMRGIPDPASAMLVILLRDATAEPHGGKRTRPVF